MSDSDRDEFFGGLDEPFGDDDPFGTDDDFADFGGDFADFGGDLGDEDADAPDFGEAFAGEPAEDETPTLFGLNRNFVIIGAVIAVVVCLGIVGLLFVIQANAGPSDVQLTVTAVYATNTFVAYALELTETQNAADAAMTATADSWTATPSPTSTPTSTSTPTPTTPPPSTIAFNTPTLEPGTGLDASGIAQTATALAAILQGATPTPEEGVPGGENGTGGVFVTPTPVSSTLPQTGLFDDGFAGGNGINGLLTAGLALLGLAGVIGVSRWLRTR